MMKRAALGIIVLCLMAITAHALNIGTMPQDSGTMPPTAIQYSPPATASGDHLFNSFTYMRLKKGDVTWSGAVNFFTPVGGDKESTFNFNTAVGCFVTDYIEAELTLLLEDTGNESGIRLSAGANRYFGEWVENVFPYIGAGISTWTGDFKDEGAHVQVKTGIRHYMSRHVGIRYWLEYDMDTDSIFDAEGSFSGFAGVFGQPF